MISDYAPKFFDKTEEFLRAHRSLLRNLIGKTITDSYIIWDLDLDKWFSDGPIVLVIGNTQVELKASQTDMYSLTTNSIDLNQPLDKDYVGDGSVQLFEWRINTLKEIAKVLNKRIDEVYIIEYDSHYQDPEGKKIGHTGFMLHGLCFRFGNEFLQMYTGLDTNGVSNEGLIRSKVFRFTKVE